VEEGSVMSNANAQGKRWFRGKFKPAAVQEPTFEGNYDSIKGFMYDCSDGRQSERYNLVTKEIAEYMGLEYTYGGNILWTIKNEAKSAAPELKDLKNKPTEAKNRIWERRVNEFMKCDSKLQDTYQTSYSLVMGQCIDLM
jgi:hypothetical protein